MMINRGLRVFICSKQKYNNNRSSRTQTQESQLIQNSETSIRNCDRSNKNFYCLSFLLSRMCVALTLMIGFIVEPIASGASGVDSGSIEGDSNPPKDSASSKSNDNNDNNEANKKRKSPTRRKPAQTTPAESAANCAKTLVTPSPDRVLAATSPLSPAPIFRLSDFLIFDEQDPMKNPAVARPVTIMNAAETAYALITSTPPRRGVEPLFRRLPVNIYPTLNGEVPEAGGRMVIGQEKALDALVKHLGALARGESVGKTLGNPGPAGTGKTELLYVLYNLGVNLAKKDEKYREMSYRFRRLYEIPALKYLHRYDKNTGKPTEFYYDPGLPRSPFTLLRKDFQEEVLAFAKPKIQSLHSIMVSQGWTDPEPKTRAILVAIFEHLFPQYRDGSKTIEDISREEYGHFLSQLEDYVVVVPRSRLVEEHEPRILRAQNDDPNLQSLFIAPNLQAMVHYKSDSPFAVNFSGKVFASDGRLLSLDELYRNPPVLLNIFLELVQNHVVETDIGPPVEMNTVPIWNANDESIRDASQKGAIKASLDRTERHPMRLLLHPHQIEAVGLFQIGLKKFKMRALNSMELEPIAVAKIYPGVDKEGNTYSAYRRYALYYQEAAERSILVSPLALNYMAWLASASRMVTDINLIKPFASELNLVTSNPRQFLDAVYRLKVILGQIVPGDAELRELSKLNENLEEGKTGITQRDIESWLREVINAAVAERKEAITPAMVDQAFERLLDQGTIKPSKIDTRAQWQNLREEIKLELLLPALEKDVRMIISGEGDRAKRIYDEVVREIAALSEDPNSRTVVSDNGQSSVPINEARLKSIKDKYRELFGREFNHNFLVKMAIKKTGPKEDPQLLQAIQAFLVESDSLTADYISSFNDYFNHDTSDPQVMERVNQAQRQLYQYGYDPESFKEAVQFVAQMRNEKLVRKRK